MMALSLLHFGGSDRRIWLYDTFTGMTDPTDADRNAIGSAQSQLAQADANSAVRAIADRQEVEKNIRETNYSFSLFNLVEGDVLTTLTSEMP